jgi:predicted nucleic acid-binding protein
MGRVKVLDTGVLIGILVAQDQHHDDCLDYVVDSNGDAYATPTVGQEFKTKIGDIRNTLSQEIKQHRRAVIRHIGKKTLDRTDLVQIRENLLETDFDAHRFLFKFYEKIADRGEIGRIQLTNMLSNIATEVYNDGAKEHGGFNSLVSGWSRGIDSYPGVESQLLICEGDDPDVCIEAHHVAETVTEDTELGTTNPKHFIRKQDGEPESRKDNILRVTSLIDVVDLSMGKYP